MTSLTIRNLPASCWAALLIVAFLFPGCFHGMHDYGREEETPSQKWRRKHGGGKRYALLDASDERVFTLSHKGQRYKLLAPDGGVVGVVKLRLSDELILVERGDGSPLATLKLETDGGTLSDENGDVLATLTRTDNVIVLIDNADRELARVVGSQEVTISPGLGMDISHRCSISDDLLTLSDADGNPLMHMERTPFGPAAFALMAVEEFEPPIRIALVVYVQQLVDQDEREQTAQEEEGSTEDDQTEPPAEDEDQTPEVEEQPLEEEVTVQPVNGDED